MSEAKKCPFCAEMINSLDRVCPYCHSNLATSNPVALVAPAVVSVAPYPLQELFAMVIPLFLFIMTFSTDGDEFNALGIAVFWSGLAVGLTLGIKSLAEKKVVGHWMALTGVILSGIMILLIIIGIISE